MADTTLLNGQVTDSITQANVKVLGDAPAQAVSTLYQFMAQATGLSMQNAVSNQQRSGLVDTATTTQAVNLVYGLPVAAAARGTVEIFSGNAMAETLAELRALQQAFPSPKPPPPRIPGAGQPSQVQRNAADQPVGPGV